MWVHLLLWHVYIGNLWLGIIIIYWCVILTTSEKITCHGRVVSSKLECITINTMISYTSGVMPYSSEGWIRAASTCNQVLSISRSYIHPLPSLYGSVFFVSWCWYFHWSILALNFLRESTVLADSALGTSWVISIQLMNCYPWVQYAGVNLIIWYEEGSMWWCN